MFGLKDLLLTAKPVANENATLLVSPTETHCAPGYWTAVSAWGRKQGLKLSNFPLTNNQKGYAQAICFEAALGEEDHYPFGRPNSGQTYAPLVILSDVDATDSATTAINGVIRQQFSHLNAGDFVADLCDVVGDLHDNVWSHGESTGISMAQRWKKPYSEDIQLVEFALADCGIGFLRELKRTGIAEKEHITNHQEAIAWCVQKGHSSKKSSENTWAQRLPSDMMGNPMGQDATIISSENHHLGLGLYKLMDLVRRYEGSLWLASGNSLLEIRSNGSETFHVLPTFWQGVAITCRFSTDALRSKKELSPEVDELERLLSDLMRGSQ